MQPALLPSGNDADRGRPAAPAAPACPPISSSSATTGETDPLPFTAADEPATLREKKAAMLEVIELQRTFIESRGESDSSTADEEAEMRWYTEQAERLDKFKAALNALRLQPVEFPVLLPQRWAVRNESTSSSRELLPYTLRFNARSQLSLVPTPLGAARDRASGTIGSSGDAELGEESYSGGSSGAPRVFFMDSLRQVRLVSSEGEWSGGTAAPPPNAGGSGASSSGPAALAPRSLCVELHGEPSLTCVTAEATELVEVLGAHLRRYNTSRVAQVNALKRLHALKCTPYDACVAAHEQMLRRLWACGFGAELKCELQSERWVHLGFQSAEPGKDFRGMGILGLSNLVYFGEHCACTYFLSCTCTRACTCACTCGALCTVRAQERSTSVTTRRLPHPTCRPAHPTRLPHPTRRLPAPTAPLRTLPARCMRRRQTRTSSSVWSLTYLLTHVLTHSLTYLVT